MIATNKNLASVTKNKAYLRHVIKWHNFKYKRLESFQVFYSLLQSFD